MSKIAVRIAAWERIEEGGAVAGKPVVRDAFESFVTKFCHGLNRGKMYHKS